MTIKPLILYLAVVVISIGSIPICKAIYTLSGDWRLVSEPLHSTMEALGALAAILMAPLLLEKRREGYDGKFFFLAMGFLGIGLLGGFHAAASLGRGSVLLYSMANLVGGFCFALIWLPRGSFARDGAFERWFPRAVIMGSAFLGIWTLMGRESLAVMVRDSEFTATAVWINLLGGVFFLAAAGRLLLDFHHFNEQESWLLALIAVLLGVTGLMFRYSSMWGMSWWFWHLVRMIAFLLMLRVLFSDFRQRAFNLRAALAEHKRAEEALHVTHHFLEIANRHIEMRLLLKEFVAEVRKFTGCTSVGIRILDKEGNIPYQAYEGFSRRFYELESPLSIKSDQCLCINVIKGLAHQNLPYCTKGGSFYINATTRFLNTLSEEEKRQAPNVCNEFGYESVALVPIRVKGRVLGLIHVADPQENMIPLHRVAGLEKISMQLGAAIQRVQIGEALQQQREALAIHSGILSIILQTMDLDQRLNIILDEVLAFLKVEFGCIHLVQGNEVVLRCWRGISDTLRAQISSFSGDKIPDWIRKPFVTHEWLSEQGLTPEFLKNEQIQAWSSLPLYVRPKEDREREWLAVIMVCSRRYDAIDEDQVRVLTIIGDQVALAIDHARTHRQARERMVRLHTLREIDKAIMQRLHFSEVLHVVLERVPKNLGADAAAISLLDAKKRDTNVFAMRLPDGTFIEEEAFILADSLLHLFVNQKEAVIIYDLTRDPRVQMHRKRIRRNNLISYLGLPLIVKDETIGILHILTTQPKVFAEEDVAFFSTMAGQAAIALENARATEALRETRDYLENLFNYANASIVVWDASFRITRFNYAFERLSGYSASEVLGQELGMLFPKESRAEALEKIALTLGGECWESVEIPILRKDGDGRIALWNSANIYSEDGTTLLATIGQGQDISEHKELEEQLRQSQKMEAIGRLAGGIAHDFNNLLTVIKGYGELFLLEFEEGDRLRGEMEEIVRAADRGADLTRQLLAFSRRQVLEVKVLDLNSLIQGTEKMLLRVLGEDIELVTHVADDLGKVKADPGQVEQVIFNLSVNVRDAMPKGGELTIETANVELDEAYGRAHIGATPGRYVMLSVSDTGVGMTPEVKDRVFEPFFTTKEEGKGTGLGLSTVYGIVKQSGGYILVYSELGKGTRFEVYLPRLDEPLEELGEEEKVAGASRGGETILVVEDEETVRKLAVRVLQMLGYQVLESSSAVDALTVCERHKESIHLVLTDVVMPQMSGRDLTERLLQRHPEIKVLYMSGYTNEAIAHHGVLEKGVNFVQKPFTVEGLARKVQQVLDK